MATRRKLSEVVKPKIVEVARRAGVKLSVRNMNGKYTWNGKTIALLNRYDVTRSDSDILHDVAHYLIASKRRRKCPEFGLGSSPDIGPPRADLLINHNSAQYEEEEASLLGILMLKALRLKYLDTFHAHLWTVTDDSLVALTRDFYDGKRKTTGVKALNRLLRKGHVSKQLVPTVMK